jgi:hypothetical protein
MYPFIKLYSVGIGLSILWMVLLAARGEADQNLPLIWLPLMLAAFANLVLHLLGLFVARVGPGALARSGPATLPTRVGAR